MRGMYQGTVFEEKDIDFVLGEGKRILLFLSKKGFMWLVNFQVLVTTIAYRSVICSKKGRQDRRGIGFCKKYQ